MLLEGAQLKPLRNDVESELRKVTETLLGEDFVWLRRFPDSAQQYWQYELTIYEETENPYHLSCGLFTGERRFRNSDLGIQAFFENNDKIVEFIYHAVSTGAMNGLVPLLGKAQGALSFAGEDRKYVDRVANVLRQKKLHIFYGRYEQAELWGKDLYTHLEEVYRKRARFCVVFLSESYRKNLWTNRERESAQTRAFEENKKCLLPVCLDDTVVPGIMPRIAYVHRKDVTIAELVGLIQKKLQGF